MLFGNLFSYTYLENNPNALALYIKKELQKEVLKTKKYLGDVLFLPTLSSALKSLTSVFGMGTGVPSSLLSPRKIY